MVEWYKRMLISYLHCHSNWTSLTQIFITEIPTHLLDVISNVVPSSHTAVQRCHPETTNQSEVSIHTTWLKPTNQSTAFTPRDSNQPIRARHSHHLTQTANQNTRAVTPHWYHIHTIQPIKTVISITGRSYPCRRWRKRPTRRLSWGWADTLLSHSQESV